MTAIQYKEIFEITRLFNKAVKKAQEENRAKGIPNVYSINGKIVFELPDGQLVDKYDFKKG